MGCGASKKYALVATDRWDTTTSFPSLYLAPLIYVSAVLQSAAGGSVDMQTRRQSVREELWEQDGARYAPCHTIQLYALRYLTIYNTPNS